MTNQEQQIIEAFGVSLLEFEIFMEGISGLFRKHPKISLGSFPVVHSVKSRIKSNDHLLDKIQRKNGEGRNITSANCFHEITDFAGVRISVK
jgi:putative GTP pyrophosphokinase